MVFRYHHKQVHSRFIMEETKRDNGGSHPHKNGDIYSLAETMQIVFTPKE